MHTGSYGTHLRRESRTVVLFLSSHGLKSDVGTSLGRRSVGFLLVGSVGCLGTHSFYLRITLGDSRPQYTI